MDKPLVYIWGKPATPELWDEWMEHIGAGPKAVKAKLQANREIWELAQKLKKQQEARDGN